MNHTYTRNGRKKSLINDENPLVMLIAFNLVFFVILNFIEIAYLLGNTELYDYKQDVWRHVVPAGQFSEFIREPWTIFTHMFAHEKVWPLIGNMLFLWGFGFLLQDLAGPRHLAPVYLYGGVGGLIIWLISLNLIPRFIPQADIYTLAGAGAPVMAIAAAATMLSPSYRIFPMIGGGIPLWVITFVYVLIDLAGLSSSAFPYHLAHLSGAGIGVLYVYALRKGTDAGTWMHRLYAGFFQLFSSDKKKSSQKENHYYDTKGIKPIHKTQHITQQRIDALLDKINQHGLESLTDEEKSFLNRISDQA